MDAATIADQAPVETLLRTCVKQSGKPHERDDETPSIGEIHREGVVVDGDSHGTRVNIRS